MTLDPAPSRTQLNYQVADALDAAADHIANHGWVQGEARIDCGTCALQAVVDALPRPVDRNVLHRALCALHPYTGGGSLVVWNDHPDRRLDEVLFALRSAANDLRRS